jgi:hypothetical protein
MLDLKQKVIAAINGASPPLKKGAFGIKGMGGDVVQADEPGITCKLVNGKSEAVAWSDIGAKAVPKVFQLAVDRTSADDWLAAALIALASGDVPMAEKCFDQARSLGTSIDRYLTPLASAAFTRAKDLLHKKQFPEAEAALASLEAKYAGIPWFATYKKSVESARAGARGGIHQAEAEKLYAEAAELFAQKEFFDLKPLVEKLKTDYATTRPVIEAERKPTFADLEKATSKLGRIVTVRLDGKGDFKSIQSAIDAAESNTMIDLGDNGPYHERLVVPRAKTGLTIHGIRGCWPVLSSPRDRRDVNCLANVQGDGTTFSRLVLSHANPAVANEVVCVRGPAALRRCIVASPLAGHVLDGAVVVDNSLVVGVSANIGRSTNSLWLVAELSGRPCLLRSCTIRATIDCYFPPTIIDSIIIGTIQRAGINTRLEYCGIVGEVLGSAPGRGCISSDPMFYDPANLDYRLRPGSPCIGKASDGGDIGCRYTPEMIELCKQALELRRKGILKF